MAHHPPQEPRASPEDVRELKAMFKSLDKDGMGTIGAEELCGLMQTIGVPHKVEDVQALLREVDTDGSGEIEYFEFERAMTRRCVLRFASSRGGGCSRPTNAGLLRAGRC